MIISIIIPHYNSAQTLERLLSSIPLTSSFITQIIIVDDGSNADEFEHLQRIVQSDNRCEFYNNECKKSAGGARNTGLKYAAGQWLLFADADDYFTDNFEKTLKTWIDSECDIIYFTPVSVNDDGSTGVRHIRLVSLINSFLESPSHQNTINLKAKFVTPWSKLIKCSIIKKNDITFDEIIASNDVMFSLKSAFAAASVAASKDSIYCVTRQTGTLSVNPREDVFDSRLDVEVRAARFLKSQMTKREFRGVHRVSWRFIYNALKWYGFKKAVRVYGILTNNKVTLFGIPKNSLPAIFGLIKVKNLEHKDEVKYMRRKNTVQK